MTVSKTTPTLPDRFSVNPLSPHYVKELLDHKIGIILNGTVRDDVEEYCISEGWIKVTAPRATDGKGKPALTTLEGNVEVYFDKYPS